MKGPRDIPHEVWDEVLKGLTELEATFVRLRFGLDDGSPLTVTEVGRALKLGRERVRQIEAKVLNKFKKISPQTNP